jgi:hypothetical protein
MAMIGQVRTDRSGRWTCRQAGEMQRLQAAVALPCAHASFRVGAQDAGTASGQRDVTHGAPLGRLSFDTAQPAIDRSLSALILVVIRRTQGIDGSRPNHARPGEKGIRCGVGYSRQFRDCPRNCKRRATPDATVPAPRISAGMGRRGKPRPASQETCHRRNQSPGGVPRKEYSVDGNLFRPSAHPLCMTAQPRLHDSLIRICKRGLA